MKGNSATVGVAMMALGIVALKATSVAAQGGLDPRALRCAETAEGKEKERKAQESLDAGILRGACDILSTASLSEPKNACVGWRAAKCYLGMGDITRGWLLLRELSKFDSSNPDQRSLTLAKARLEELRQQNSFINLEWNDAVETVEIERIPIPLHKPAEVIMVRPGRYWIHVGYNGGEHRDIVDEISPGVTQSINLAPLQPPSTPSISPPISLAPLVPRVPPGLPTAPDVMPSQVPHAPSPTPRRWTVWIPALVSGAVAVSAGLWTWREAQAANDAYQRYQSAKEQDKIAQARNDTDRADGWRNVGTAVAVTSAMASVFAVATVFLARPEPIGGVPDESPHPSSGAVRVTGGPALAGAGVQVPF